MAIKFTDTIKPNGPFPIAESAAIQGGLHSVETSELLQSIIDNQTVEEGMLVYIQSTLEYKQYKQGKWEDANLGGVLKVSSIADEKLQKASSGDLVYIEDKKVLTYVDERGELKGLGHSIPIYTTPLKELLQSVGITPKDYIDLGNPMLVGYPATEQISILPGSGDYLLILFKAIRALLNEVARLKNSFYYGIQSLNEGYTTSSEIVNQTLAEAEPLWAIDPEDLAELTDLEIEINSTCQLLPATAWTYDSSTNYINITGTATTPNVDVSEAEFEEGPSSKILCYCVIDPTIDDWGVIINFDNNTSFNIKNLPIAKLKMHILFILSRKVQEEDSEIAYGKNYYYVSISNVNNDRIFTSYLNASFTPSALEVSLEEVPMIKSVSLKGVKLYRLNYYTKQLAFSNDAELIPEKAVTDDFVYKASHITVRSVSSYAYLKSIVNRLLPNEPILCTDTNPDLAGLYFKRPDTNELMKIGVGSNNPTQPDITGMTQEQMIEWLVSQNLIVSANAGYELNPASIDFSKIDPDALLISGITVVNEDTEESFQVKVDYEGNLYTEKLTDVQVNAATDNGSTADSDADRYGPRGAAAKFSFGNSVLLGTTAGTEVSQVTIDGNSNIITKALGDRIRFGSWYIPNKGLATFNCSHDFIEIVNSGTFNYSLKDAVLGIIYRNDIEPAATTLYGKHYSILEFPITSNIANGSSYLIRGKRRCDIKKARVKISEYDQVIDFDFVTKECVGLLLYHKNLSGHLTITDGNGDIILRPLMKANSGADKGTFPFYCDMRLLDVITFNGAHDKLMTLASSGLPLYTKASYKKHDDCIGKDLYSLDPARQGFRSLTLEKLESTNCRLSKVLGEEIPLNADKIGFPHSANITEVSKFTPKASKSKKNILTDKTSPDFTKPNMVTCSFGINAATTRCFNWISMSRTNEYVWIRKAGEQHWARFESYKLGDGTDAVVADTLTTMHRKEFTKNIVNAVYARIDNTFPGDASYIYRAHKCVVYIQPEMATGAPVIYEYIVGESNELGLPKNASYFDVHTFTIYPKDWTPKVYHTTDQQGFGWMEYLEWSAAAEELNSRIYRECTLETKNFPVFINTGDMTQNGTRINEWLDYYNGGKCLFTHLELMNVIGNNDLCNSYSETSLGNGDDDGKTSPYYFHVFYCYEVPNETKSVANWSHSLIYNGVYVPSMYYFYFDKYGYLMINSELTPTTCNRYYKQFNEPFFYNLYTGGASNSTTQLTALSEGYLAKTIESWIAALNTVGVPAKNIIAACHEMPFTVTTYDNLMSGTIGVDRSISGANLVGSHLNVLGTDAAWKTYDYTYWFSKMLLDKGVKLCIGGHKHTYAVTYPAADLNNGNASDKMVGTYHFSKKCKLKRSAPSTPYDSIDGGLWDYDNSITNGVVYFMCLATGYKQKSNKELPSRTQGYSKIVPESVWTSKDNGQTWSGTADVSLTYPMYATYSYDTNKIHANLYRVINIKKEAISNNKAVVTEFSEMDYATSKMYSELLVITPDATLSGVYSNYWVIPEEGKIASVGMNGENVVDKQRCIHVSGNTYKSVSGNFTADSNNTIDIDL